MFFWINSKVFSICKTNVKGYSKSGLAGNRYNLIGWEEYNIRRKKLNSNIRFLWREKPENNFRII